MYFPEMIGKSAIPPTLPSSAPRTPYETAVRTLSDRLVEAQRPIRILDAVKWDDSVERDFFAADAKELPRVTRESYRSLPFEPATKIAEFASIEAGVRSRIGASNGLGKIMIRMCREYSNVVRMLAARGTPEFSALS